jgi:hypothetical protein
MLDGCRLIELPRIADHRGNLSFVEGGRHVPFDIRRVYYLYDVPAGEARGGHAHRELQQVLIAVSGSFDVLLDNGRRTETVSLNRPFVGLYMTNMIWRELLNFSSGSVCLVLASEPFEEADYIREHHDFVRLASAANG